MDYNSDFNCLVMRYKSSKYIEIATDTLFANFIAEGITIEYGEEVRLIRNREKSLNFGHEVDNHKQLMGFKKGDMIFGEIYDDSYFEKLSVQAPDILTSFRLKPTIINSYFTIEFDHNVTKANIYIYNLNGIEVERCTILNSSEQVIDISRLNNGVYIIVAESDQNVYQKNY